MTDEHNRKALAQLIDFISLLANKKVLPSVTKAATFVTFSIVGDGQEDDFDQVEVVIKHLIDKGIKKEDK